MNTGTILSKDIGTVLDMLEYAFHTHKSVDDQNDPVIYVLSKSFKKAEIDISDFAIALHFLAEKFPQIKVEYIYDFINGDPPREPRELDVDFHSMADIRVPKDFNILLSQIRESMNIVRPKQKLSEIEIKFDDESSHLKAGGKTFEVPKGKAEALLCRVIFNERVNVPISWDLIAERIDGFETVGKRNIEKRRRSIQDSMYQMNDRVRRELNTEDELFSWADKSITRNY